MPFPSDIRGAYPMLHTLVVTALLSAAACLTPSDMPDAGLDASADAPHDAPDGDSRRDATLRDTGSDAPLCIDAGATACHTGRPCTTACGCSGGTVCQLPIAEPGGPLPDCVTGADVPIPASNLYEGGYCTNADVDSPQAVPGSPSACDLNLASDDPAQAGMDGCEPCAKCVRTLVASSTGADVVQCLARCVPSATGAGGCRAGYSCGLGSHTCEPRPCDGDASCRAVEFPSDGGVSFCADPTSASTCNVLTGRCVGTGGTGHAGDPCTHDADCEAEGRCFAEVHFPSAPGGYCTKLGCDVPGLECVAGETCLYLAPALCTRRCTVGGDDVTSVLGVGGHGDTCRPGFACFYDSHSPAGTPGNGGCFFGNYNDVTVPNIGHPCLVEADCYSPFGDGFCGFETNPSCSVRGCAGFPDPGTVCVSGSTCISLGRDFSLCLLPCATDADCVAAGSPTGYRCVLPAAGTSQRVCMP